MIYSFSRDGALPLSNWWYHISPNLGGPVRAIWLSIVLAFILGLPGLSNPSALSALFSLTATGLYSSYIIPVILRLTVGRASFEQKEFSLGVFSIPIGIISVLWGLFMVSVLCLPQSYPATGDNLNYSPIALGCMLGYALVSWIWARKWFKGAIVDHELIMSLSTLPHTSVSQSELVGLCDPSPQV